MYGKKLFEQVKDKIRVKHYSINTEKTYAHWIYHYVLFHNKKHPKDMGKPEIEAFLTSLAKQSMAATTQNQALNAIMFLYNDILGISMKEANRNHTERR
ncbi:phage integrase N-terminal SAM-like domain-containing protein [Suttonella sp. R2A3]|uniref:phage integrase N-terminal SAM-like domain-containing protein n=1 Tax=Suttonella sp. R2A3 TaxID=2908648 RepID=UPI0038FBFD0C